jgi:hypothetical protein
MNYELLNTDTVEASAVCLQVGPVISHFANQNGYCSSLNVFGDAITLLLSLFQTLSIVHFWKGLEHFETLKITTLPRIDIRSSSGKKKGKPVVLDTADRTIPREKVLRPFYPKTRENTSFET